VSGWRVCGGGRGVGGGGERFEKAGGGGGGGQTASAMPPCKFMLCSMGDDSNVLIQYQSYSYTA